MRNIRINLLISFSIIIGLMLIVNVFITMTYFDIEREYKKITDNMIMEYSVTETFSDMVDSYTLLLQDIDDRETRAEYDASGNELEYLFSQLDVYIVSEESRTTYNKVKNMARSVKGECDGYLLNVEGRNFTGGSGIYDRAISGEEYVNDNVAKLLLSELKFSKSIQERLEYSRNLMIFICTILIAVVTFGCVIYGLHLSNKISKPIIKLSKIAKDISEGNETMHIKKDLLENPNREINSLSNSFNVMLNNLRDKIKLLEKANTFAVKAKKELEDSQKELKVRNEELERFNSLAVGRELKKEISALKEKTARSSDKEKRP